MPRPKQTTDKDKITQRLQQGKWFVEYGLAQRDAIHSKRFLDGSETAGLILYDNTYGEGIIPHSLEVGNINYLAINVLTKVAAISIADPDWHVEHDDPELAEIASQYFKDLFRKNRWQRITRKALLKRYISGMGCIAYLWDANDGPVIQHVRAGDLSIDPNVTDWRNLKWGARRIWIPKDEAEKRWPQQKHQFLVPHEQQVPVPLEEDKGYARSRNNIEVWNYWDKTTEAVLYGDTFLEYKKNPYEKVPLLFLEGDIAPESELSLGDFDLATQIQIMMSRLYSALCNQAENGGAIGWYNEGMLADGEVENFGEGRPQQFVGITGDPENAFGYVTGEPLSQALIEAIRTMQSGLDSTTAVTEYMRGVLTNKANFATEAAFLANQSGSRGTQARIEYELFMDDIAHAILEMTIKFGPTMMDETDDNDVILYTALEGVREIDIIESSTSYKDPAVEAQKWGNLLQNMLPFIEAGILNPVPLITQVLRANGIQDVSKFIMAPPPMPPTEPPATGMETGGAVPPGIAPPNVSQAIPQSAAMLRGIWPLNKPQANKPNKKAGT